MTARDDYPVLTSWLDGDIDMNDWRTLETLQTQMVAALDEIDRLRRFLDGYEAWTRDMRIRLGEIDRDGNLIGSAS
jgi:hypothetical protein